MAEEQIISYRSDPAKYNKECMNRWETWFKEFEDRIIENFQLLDNYSQDLADRKADNESGRLIRACLFVPIVNPSVLARAADMVVKMWGVEKPIEVLPVDQPNSRNVKGYIHQCLEKNDFDMTYFMMKIAQESLPICFLKISEYEEENLELSIEPVNFSGNPEANVQIAQEKKWNLVKKQWYPKITHYCPQYVFYEPEPNVWEKKGYIGTITPLTLAELVSRIKSHGYSFDIQKLKDTGEKWSDDFTKKVSTSAKQEDKEVSPSTKFKVIEMFHIVEDEKGNVSKKITTSCGDVTLKDVDFPYEKLNITDIFIPCVGYPMLNRVEGTCTVDLQKHLQHALNDSINLVIDTAKYGLFPPRARDSRAKIISEDKIEPAGEIVLDLQGCPPGATIKDVITQIFEVSPTGKDFFALANTIREWAEIVGGAPQDILMGVVTDPQEKATKTQARVQGTNTRLAGINIFQDVRIMKKLAYVLWTMALERLGIDEQYPVGNQQLNLTGLMGDFTFDVPHLSGMPERELKIQKLDKLLMMLGSMPFFKHPAMMPVLYSIIQEKAKAEMIDNFDQLFPKEVIMAMMIPPPIIPPGGGETQVTGQGDNQ